MNRCTVLIVALLLCCSGPQFVSGQVIFSEDFSSYADGTTAGTGSSWTAVCGACASGDRFEVRSGALEAVDVNDFSTWETQAIDISTCATTVSFSLDATEDGDHEGPGCACGINVDYFDVYYSINNGPFTVIENWNGDGEVGHTLTGDSQNGVLTDSDWGSTTVTQTGIVGNTLTLRVVMRNTSGSERLILDNVLVNCDALLPVEWAFVEGRYQDQGVMLNWGTVSEVNASHFIVQRSADGNDFTNLSEVPAQGLNGAHYEFQDALPLSGTSFYRLRQVDYSGASTESKIIEIATPERSLDIQAPYPNPGSEVMRIVLMSGKTQTAEVQLYNLVGQLVRQETLSLNAEVREWDLDLKGLTQGQYILLIKGEEQQEQFRIAVQ